MSFNINEMRSQLRFEGARPTLFECRIFNPGNASGDLKTPFMVEAAEIPSSSLGLIQVPYFGRPLKLAGDRTYSPWAVTIINDEDFLIRNAMEEWSNRINSFQGNFRRLGRYKSDAEVIQYSKTGSVLRIYTLYGLFPEDVSPITLNWGDTDNIERFQVTFQYDYWTVTGGNTGDAGGS